jgi:hypothetical protein
MPFWLAIPLSAICGAIFCTVLLLPCLPLRGVYFAIVTLWIGGDGLFDHRVEIRDPAGDLLDATEDQYLDATRANCPS